jgi:hypothetical protein
VAFGDWVWGCKFLFLVPCFLGKGAGIDRLREFSWLICSSQYCYIVWGIWLRHCLNGRQDEFELVWPRILSVPVVVKRDSRQATAAGNGHIKKMT